MYRSVAWVGALTLILGLAPACSDQTLHQAPEEKLPAIEVDPLSLEFGQLESGSSMSGEVTITSIGEVDLEITDLFLDAPADFELIADATEFTLEPYASEIVEVVFTANGDGDVGGELLITNTDPTNPQVPVQLHGAGLAPAIMIDPDVWDFGSFEVGCENTVDISVMSVGSYILTIEDSSFTTTGSMAMVTNELAPGLQMAPGEERLVQISFTPEDVTDYDGLLTVLSDDPGQPTAEGIQMGEGVAGAWYSDHFDQEGNNWTDILWVVDNSCSMSEEQATLGDDFQYFYSIVNSVGIDYRIATVTTDNANFQGSPTVIDVNTPNGASAFASNCSLGTNGSGTERGLKFGWDAVDMAIGGGGNGGWYREDAGLRVVFVSDEPDQSGSWSTYTNNYLATKANPDHVVLSAICGTDGANATSCNGAGGNASAGTGYVDAVNYTGGILASICDASWSSALSSLAWQAISLADTFELSHSPVIESTIAVEINGTPITVGWYFDAATNSVIFEPNYVPQDGDSIDISYGVEGTCGG